MKRQLGWFVILLWLACTIQLGWLWPAVNTTLTFSLGFVIIAVLAFGQRWSTALWYSLAQGSLIDIYSPYIFGTYIITSLVLAICIGLLQDTWLKQRSLLSVATIAGVSLFLTQLLLLVIVALSEYNDIIITRSTTAVTSTAFIIGLFSMIGLTLGGVRLLNRKYVKLI